MTPREAAAEASILPLADDPAALSPPEPVRTEALIPDASAFIYALLRDRLPPTIVYHTFQHHVEVVESAQKIGRKSGLTREDLALVTLAAWFHDTGFTETYEDHEAAGARIARQYLERHHLMQDKIERVATLILATHPDHEPENLLEQVIHDADLAHLGRDDFFQRSDLLRREWADHRGRVYSEQEWAEVQLSFLLHARFYTPYAREKYARAWERHLRTIHRRLAALLDAPHAASTPAAPAPPSPRGTETMFRSTYRNHINLSAIADSKANIMISVNAILMSIIISFLSTRLQTDAWLMVPSATLLLTSLVAIVFAILSARPKVTHATFTLDEVRRNKANILFFGNFVNVPPDTFRAAMHELIENGEALYDNMIADVYSLGKVLSRKYRLLWISYTVFMAGLTLSVLLFLLLFFAY